MEVFKCLIFLTILSSSAAHPRLNRAYEALQAWKTVIYSDPYNFTANWVGRDVCSYNGIVCAPAIDDASTTVVAGIDLNHADIAGSIPDEIGNLSDIAILHMNSNRFCGIIPESIKNLPLLYELDLSNNRFVGPFPEAVLELPTLKYLDLRFNDFEGPLPPQLFQKDLDAIILNNNRFDSTIPSSFGNSNASIIVIASNRLSGCIPSGIGMMRGKLDELILSDNELSGCLPEDIAMLNSTTVLDMRKNKFAGELPRGMNLLQSLEIMDISENEFSSRLSGAVCTLPNLKNLTISHNYFDSKDAICDFEAMSGLAIGESGNCFEDEDFQRPREECIIASSKKVDCRSAGSCTKTPKQPVPAPQPAGAPIRSPQL